MTPKEQKDLLHTISETLSMTETAIVSEVTRKEGRREDRLDLLREVYGGLQSAYNTLDADFLSNGRPKRDDDPVPTQ